MTEREKTVEQVQMKGVGKKMCHNRVCCNKVCSFWILKKFKWTKPSAERARAHTRPSTRKATQKHVNYALYKHTHIGNISFITTPLKLDTNIETKKHFSVLKKKMVIKITTTNNNKSDSD